MKRPDALSLRSAFSFLPVLLSSLTVFPAAAGANAPEEPLFVTVTQKDSFCIVKEKENGPVVFKHREPRRAIEEALRRSRIAVLTGGTFNVQDGVMIPQPGVTLIIAPDATLQNAKGAQFSPVTEGHGNYRPLIHNKGMDNVAVLNFGTLRTVPDGGACIMYNGRSKGTLGINGGVVFSTGVLDQCGDAIWLVDAKNLQVPFAGACQYDNNLMAIEGCEDLTIDVVAGLAGSNGGENETIDFNSYSRRVHIKRMIGTSRSEQVLDVNNSTGIVVDEITGYADTGSFRDTLVSIIHYGPNGRRLTQRPRIEKSRNIQIKKKGVASEKISDWKITTSVDRIFATLPELTVKVRVIGNPRKNPVTVIKRTYLFRLGEKQTVTILNK